jgi:hypothetical protein
MDYKIAPPRPIGKRVRYNKNHGDTILISPFKANTTTIKEKDNRPPRLGHIIIDKPILVIVDGLKLHKDSLHILALKTEEIKSVIIDGEDVAFKIVPSVTYEEDGVLYQGTVSLKTRLLFVVNGKSLYKRKDKQAVLSKIKQSDIVMLQKISATDAFQRWGRVGKHGAVIIYTKNINLCINTYSH